MKRKVALIILNRAATAVVLGGLYDMFMPAAHVNLLDYLGLAKTALSPRRHNLS